MNEICSKLGFIAAGCKGCGWVDDGDEVKRLIEAERLLCWECGERASIFYVGPSREAEAATLTKDIRRKVWRELPAESVGKPWEALGISRSTWYRWTKQERG